jgi:DNA segregation ATPase FtsK/SpoIIIE, S-DNA-T family
VAESTAQSRAPLRFSTSVARGLREGAAIALAVLALVLLVALLSFDINDNGFTTKGASLVLHNRVGPIGAWLSGALLFLFGRPAYLLPVMLGIAGWRLARVRSADEQH